MSVVTGTPLNAFNTTSPSSSSSSPALSTLPGAVETPLLTCLGLDLDTWEARFNNMSAQTRDVLLVYLKVNFAKHVEYMAGSSPMEEKMRRDADVKDMLHLYLQTFVCLSVVFPSVFANADYSMAVLDSLQEIDVLILRSMADGTSLSLDQIFPIVLKPDKSGINLRAMSKEKNMPIRKNPLVMCFEGALVYLSISRGLYKHLLIPNLSTFIETYPEFDYSKSYQERYHLATVKPDEKDKFCKTQSPPEVNLLFRCYNMMVVVVEMTNDKAFKCCELSVRLIEGESGQGFKPGGDNGPRILHRMHLHSLLVKAKRNRPTIIPSTSMKRDRAGFKYLDILTGAVKQEQLDDKNRSKRSPKQSKSKNDIAGKTSALPIWQKPSKGKKADELEENHEKNNGGKRTYTKKKSRLDPMINLASTISDQQPVGNLEFLNQLAEVAGALHSEETNNAKIKKAKKSDANDTAADVLGSMSMSVPPNSQLPMHMNGAMTSMPGMSMPMPGIPPMSALQLQQMQVQMQMQMQMQLQQMQMQMNMPHIPLNLSMPSMSSMSLPSPSMPITSEFIVPVQFAKGLEGLDSHPTTRDTLSTEGDDMNGAEESQELSQVSIESNISKYNDHFR